jgi:hypothetical protein
MSDKPIKRKFFFFPFYMPKTKELTEEEKEELRKETNLELFQTKPNDFGAEYIPHLLDQYRLAVEMANFISERRSQANKFFMSINSTLIGVGAVVSGYLTIFGATLWIWLISAVGLLMTYYWYRIVESYDQLNTGKFLVIHEIETKLPLAISHSEWKALGEGENEGLYRPFTRTEILIPRLFAWFYVVIALAIFLYAINCVDIYEPFPVRIPASLPPSGG